MSWQVDVRDSGPLPALDWRQIPPFSADTAADVIRSRLLFDDYRAESEKVAIVRDPASVPANLWFIGDLHGDLLALAHAWRYIHSQPRNGVDPPALLFLGDFIDRGPHSHDVLQFLFQRILENPGRVGVLPGNHDEELQYDAATGGFSSGVDPAEYAIWLSEHPDQRAIRLARLAIDFFRSRPRAIFLPDGLVIAHGGFPHTDLLERLQTPADFGRPECLQDFVWLRISANSPRKRPVRGIRGCEFGYEDFADFCRHSTEKLGIPVRRLLRGHDHVPDRFCEYAHYHATPVLTLNTMCRRLDDEWDAPEFPLACVARYVPGQLPEVHRLAIDQREIADAYHNM